MTNVFLQLEHVIYSGLNNFRINFTTIVLYRRDCCFGHCPFSPVKKPTTFWGFNLPYLSPGKRATGPMIKGYFYTRPTPRHLP